MAMQFTEMDERVRFADQMQHDGGPVVLINRFNVAPEDADDLVSAWADDAVVMRQMPGHISAQLHRGIAGSATFVNIAVWESAAAFAAAFQAPEFQSRLTRYPDSATPSPHLFERVAVPQICIA
jgi:heme-degrading monooxygenase HmoA